MEEFLKGYEETVAMDLENDLTDQGSPGGARRAPIKENPKPVKMDLTGTDLVLHAPLSELQSEPPSTLMPEEYTLPQAAAQISTPVPLQDNRSCVADPIQWLGFTRGCSVSLGSNPGQDSPFANIDRSQVPDAFQCPITGELMRDPVMCSDGHTYEREAIEEWFRHSDQSPLTGAALQTLVLTPNFAVKKAIEELVSGLPQPSPAVGSQNNSNAGAGVGSGTGTEREGDPSSYAFGAGVFAGALASDSTAGSGVGAGPGAADGASGFLNAGASAIGQQGTDLVGGASGMLEHADVEMDVELEGVEIAAPEIDLEMPGLDSIIPPELQKGFSELSNSLGKILAGFGQVLSSMADNLSTVPFPEPLIRMMGAFSMLNFDIFEGIAPECIVASFTYYDVYSFTVGFPLILLILNWGTYFIRYLCSPDERNHNTIKKLHWKFFCMLAFFLYPMISSGILKLFHCREVENVAFLHVDYRIKCYDNEWTWYAYTGAVFAIFYIVGIPAILTYMLYVYKDALFDKKHPSYRYAQSCFGFLVKDYTSDGWFWELTMMAQKFFLTALIIFIESGTVSQLAAGFLISFFFLTLLLQTEAYHESNNQLMQMGSMLCITLTMLCGILYKLDFETEDDNGETEPLGKMFIDVLIIFINLTVMSLFLYLMIAGLKESYDEYKERADSAEALKATLEEAGKKKELKKRSKLKRGANVQFGDVHNEPASLAASTDSSLAKAADPPAKMADSPAKPVAPAVVPANSNPQAELVAVVGPSGNASKPAAPKPVAPKKRKGRLSAMVNKQSE